MKKLLLMTTGLSALAASTGLHADFLYQGGDANWTGSNWYNTVGPVANSAPGTGTDNHNFGTYWNSGTAGVVTVNSTVATNDLGADRGNRTLDVVSGGSVTVNGKVTVNNRANEASALTISMSGTTFSVTSDLVMGSGNSGDATNFNLNTGTLDLLRGGSLNQFFSAGVTSLNVQGGAFTGAPTTGFTVNTNGALNVNNVTGSSVNLSGNLILAGGQANITGDAAGTLQLGAFSYQGLSVKNSASQLSYVFDATGVSALNMGRLSFDAATTLNLSVNADALAGATVGQQILLMDYTEWRLGGVDQGSAPILPQIFFSNTGSTITGVLVNDTVGEALYFQITSTTPGLVVPAGVDVAIVGADVQCTFDSVNGQSYQLLVSTDDMASFAPVGEVGSSGTGDGTPLTLTDTGGVPASGQRVFYRVETN